MKSRNGLSLAGAVLMSLLLAGTASAAYQVGDLVADWTLFDAHGQRVTLSNYEGMVVLLNFWASW